jgi:hypothetical protein
VSALPVDQEQENPLDPERILRVLPDRERETFLAQYRRAVDGARDPAGWKHLQRFLRLWAGRAINVNRPGFYEARDRALADTGGGMLLDDAMRVTPDSSSSRSMSLRDWSAYTTWSGSADG